MYPTRLNLLSPEKRTYLRRMIYIQFIKNTLISIVFVFCVSGITLLGGQWVLQEYFNDVSTNLVATNNGSAERNQKIKEVNYLISETDALQQTYIIWSSIIVELTNAIPNGIVINDLSLNSGDKYVLSGIADTRENMLEMQKKLNTLDFIKNTKIPISQLTEKENFAFSISATVK